MNKICTDVEQSDVLIKSGIDVSTADMKYPYFGDGQYGTTPVVGECIKFSGGADIPAWSLSALLKLMPESLTPDNGSHQVYYMEVYNHDGLYCCDYVGEIERDSFVVFAEEDYIDAATEMVKWLLENKKISK